MNKALIFYFSGTNNTKIIAEEVANNLETFSYATDLYNIRLPFEKIPDLSRYDIIGFGYPIHAFNTPEFFLRFIKKLPVVKNIKAFVFKTSGEPFRFNNASSFSLVRVLKKKGFNVLLEEHFLMPYNIWFRYPDEIAKFMYKYNKILVKAYTKRIIEDKQQVLRYNPLTVLFSYIARFQWLGAKINGPLMHVKKSKCTACKICVNNCPSKNIRIVDGYAKFDHTCTMCMSCVSICPYDAVRPGVLNGWRVNGLYPFEKMVKDANIKDITIDKNTKGYFKLFRKYYQKKNDLIEKTLSKQ